MNSEFFECKNYTGTQSENSSKFWSTFTQGWDKVPNLTVKLGQILKRSLGVCFDFDGSKFVSSSDRLFVKYFLHKRSRCEFIQLQKRLRGVFQNHGVWGASVSSSRLPSPSPLLPSVLHSPQFSRRQKAKPQTGGKAYGNACYVG